MKFRDDPDRYEICAMVGVFIISLALLACAVLTLGGCRTWFDEASSKAEDAGQTLTTIDAAGGYHVLTWIFNGCMVLAALSVVLMFVAPSKAKPWATAGLVTAGIMAIALKVLLVKYMPWLIAIGCGSFLVCGVAFAYAHRWAIEKFLRKDLDGDGSIGEKDDRPL